MRVSLVSTQVPYPSSAFLSISASENFDFNNNTTSDSKAAATASAPSLWNEIKLSDPLSNRVARIYPTPGPAAPNSVLAWTFHRGQDISDGSCKQINASHEMNAVLVKALSCQATSFTVSNASTIFHKSPVPEEKKWTKLSLTKSCTYPEGDNPDNL